MDVKNRITDTPEPFDVSALDRSEMNLHFPRPNNWKERAQAVEKYVDDFLGIEKLALCNDYKIFSTNRPYINIQAKTSEQFFEHVRTTAAEVGLRVNQKKTQILAISGAESVSTYVDIGGERIRSQDTLKLLGFTFDSRPNCNAYIDQMALKFRRRLWILRHLKKANLPREDLLSMYRCFLLPVTDYACPIYHSMIGMTQKLKLENLQAKALKIIFGFELSYRKILETYNIENLEERRQKQVDKFIILTSENPKFAEKWFPRRPFIHHDLREELIYEEKYARTDRLYNSPLYYMRRRRNEL